MKNMTDKERRLFNMHDFGTEVRDRYSAFIGSVTSKCVYVDGSVEYGVTCKGDGTTCTSLAFHPHRLEPVENYNCSGHI